MQGVVIVLSRGQAVDRPWIRRNGEIDINANVD